MDKDIKARAESLRQREIARNERMGTNTPVPPVEKFIPFAEAMAKNERILRASTEKERRRLAAGGKRRKSTIIGQGR